MKAPADEKRRVVGIVAEPCGPRRLPSADPDLSARLRSEYAQAVQELDSAATASGDVPAPGPQQPVGPWMDAAWLAADAADAAAYGTHDVPTDVIQYRVATRGPRFRLDDADTVDLAAARRAGRIL